MFSLKLLDRSYGCETDSSTARSFGTVDDLGELGKEELQRAVFVHGVSLLVAGTTRNSRGLGQGSPLVFLAIGSDPPVLQ